MVEASYIILLIAEYINEFLHRKICKNNKKNAIQLS